jgi:hypothetical protein
VTAKEPTALLNVAAQAIAELRIVMTVTILQQGVAIRATVAEPARAATGDATRIRDDFRLAKDLGKCWRFFATYTRV